MGGGVWYLVIAVYQSQASLWRSKYQELQRKEGVKHQPDSTERAPSIH